MFRSPLSPTGILCALCAVLLLPIALAESTFVAIAGSAKSGFSGDGQTANFALFNNCSGIACDRAGNIYVCDENNHRIRKITPTGLVSTVAGTGTPGFSGDGGPATAAQLNQPSSIAADSLGNLYFTDELNHRIRVIDTAGNISTFAGTGNQGFNGVNGPASAADISRPNFIAIDALDRVHFISSDRVLGIDAGILLLIAGNGTTGFSGDGGPADQASFVFLGGLAFGPAGDLFVLDIDGHRIRKIDTLGIITTVGGTGVAGFSGDGGPATAANLGFPGDGLTCDSKGNLYFGDYGSTEMEPRLRRIDSNGIITTVGGNGQPGAPSFGGNPLTSKFTGTRGITIDPLGDVIFSFSTDTSDGEPDRGAGVLKLALNVSLSVQNPDTGLGVEVLSQDGGLVQLAVNPDTLIRAPFSINTDFEDIPTRAGSSAGTRPTHQYIQSGLFVSTSVATDDATGLNAGRMRKTLAVSRSNTGESPLVTAQPNSRDILGFQMKGKFLFTAAKSDAVSFSGTIELPTGLNLATPQELSFAVGNVIDTVTLDTKGKAQLPSARGLVKSASLKYPKPASGTATGPGQRAKLTLQYSAADLDTKGFDTEGVTPQARQRDPAAKSYPRAIQCAVLLGGITYELKAPVQLKVNSAADTGQIQGRSLVKVPR